MTGPGTYKPRYKTCTKCGTRKHVKLFVYLKSETRHHSWCRSCMNKAANARYYAHRTKPEKLRLRQYHKRRRAKFLKQGRCDRCGKHQLPNSKMCELHYLTTASHYSLGIQTKKAAQLLLDKFNAGGRKCPYTREPLILSVNAQLDHILPRSRFPELKHDIDNVEWISAVANRAKHDMTKKEFLLHYGIYYIP